MQCASCGHVNPAGSRFCSGCGSPLALRCLACATENPAGARFCNGCGTSLSAPRPAADAVSRKIVTIVFADLIGSMSLHERLDAESARSVMDRYHRAMSAAVVVHGGRVVQLLGDGVLAAFGVPRVAEDDAIRAVRSAVGMQRAFRELARAQSAALGGVGLRVAVNTGEVVVSDDENSVMGDPTNVAARLQQEARDGDVIVGEGTQRLVGSLVTLAPLGSFALRGRAESVAAYRVVSLDRPASAQAIAFVGREEELRRLVAVYDAAVATPAAKLAVLLGSPGLGKSRLVAEFTRRAGERATVLSARCDADGGATFAPLAGALRALLRIDEGAGGDVLRAAIDAVVSGDDAERTRIATGIGALLGGTPAPPEETFFVVRRLLAALAAVRPVVLMIDDLQWAEPLLLDLVEHLVQWSGVVPLLVLVAARPELRDARSALATPGGLVADVVTLAGLDAGAATRLAANVIGGSELPAALAGRVLATSEGNPLFVSELVRMLVQDGTLQRDGDRWITTVEIAKLDMPPTIQVLLAARIERLRPEERSVLERAAVVGRQFSRAAVAQLLPREVHDLDARLEALRRSELIEPDTGWFLGEPALRFHHVLIRDAAYRRVLKETRAELHARTADWIVARVGDAIEHDEAIGWHLEQAHQYLRDLGSLDANGRTLGERAARHLGAAGRRALARDDLSLAAGLLGRALERLDADDPARADLALDWCEALLAAGDVVPAVAALDELGRFCADSPRLRAWHVCFVGQLAVLTDPQALRTTADAVASAVDELAAIGDAAGEAKAHFVHAMALVRLGKIGACETALDRALAAARRAHDRRRANAVLAGAPVAALWGPSPVTRASGRCLDVVRVLRITQGAPAVEAVALRCQGVLEALRGRTDAARRMVATSRRLVEELGITQRLLEADVFAGHVELIDGDAEAAERWLRTAYDGLRDLGLGIDAAQAGALLGRALLAQDRASDAEALSHESEALAGDDLKAAITWRGVRAEALARRGEHAAAIAFAQAAVEIAAATDDLLDHADARQSLAIALRAAGSSEEADAEDTRAIELWEAKGATLLVERAQRAGGRGAHEGRASETVRTGQRRVRPNAATENTRRFNAVIAARDSSALSSLWAADAEVIHHPTGASFERGAAVASIRDALEMTTGLALERLTLATLGDALTLCRLRASATEVVSADYPVGAVDLDQVLVVEVNERCEMTRTEIFAPDHLADAIARLYERHAEGLPDGPLRTRAAMIARAVADLLLVGDAPSLEAVLAPDTEFVDHRLLGFPSSHPAESIPNAQRALFEHASDVSIRVHDVLALEGDSYLLHSKTSGTDRASGGRFETEFLQLRIFGPDGRVARTEWFDVDCAADALARLEALCSKRDLDAIHAPFEPDAESPQPRFANAATRCVERAQRCWDARDLDGMLDCHAPTCVVDDRRAMVRLEITGEEFVANQRVLFDIPWIRFRSELLATRGESLALFFVRFAGEAPDNGEIEVDHLSVVETGEDGRAVAFVLFDPNARDAAQAELDRRYTAGEGAPHAALLANLEAFRVAVAAGDRDALVQLLPDDFTLRSHRRFGNTGMPFTREAYLESLRALETLGARGELRLDHARISAAAVLADSTWSGARDGGDFELPVVAVFAHAGGRIRRAEFFDPEQFDAARALFADLSRGDAAPPAHIENAATRAAERLRIAFQTLDVDAIAALLSPHYRNIDRQKTAQLESDRDRYLAAARPMLASFSSSRVTTETVATRGSRHALGRIHWAAAAGETVGSVELDWFSVIEVDASGLIVLQVDFDADDLDAAFAELDARFAAGEAAAERRATVTRAFSGAFARRDWDALAALLAPDLVVQDHRLLGWETLHGPSAYVQALHTLVDLAPDTQLRIDHVSIAAPCFLYVTTWVGTREGGAFETPSVIVSELDAQGRIRRFDQYDIDRLDEIRAGLAATASTTGRDPLRIPPNAASRAGDRLREYALAADWDALRDLCAPTVFDDRRKLFRVSGGCEMIVANTQAIDRSIWERSTRTLLQTAGDRLALHRNQWRGRETGSAFEVDTLELTEVDADGRIVAAILFDSDARRAAGDEMLERFMRGDEAPPFFASQFDAMRGLVAHDLEPLQNALPADFYVDDRRHAGLATPNAATRASARTAASFASEDWQPALRALASPLFRFEDRRRRALVEGDVDVWIRNLEVVRAWPGRRTRAALLASFGECIAIENIFYAGDAGGAEYEGEFLRVVEVDDDGLLRAVLHFDPEDRDAAFGEAQLRFASQV